MMGLLHTALTLHGHCTAAAAMHCMHTGRSLDLQCCSSRHDGDASATTTGRRPCVLRRSFRQPSWLACGSTVEKGVENQRKRFDFPVKNTVIVGKNTPLVTQNRRIFTTLSAPQSVESSAQKRYSTSSRGNGEPVLVGRVGAPSLLRPAEKIAPRKSLRTPPHCWVLTAYKKGVPPARLGETPIVFHIDDSR